MRAFSFLHCFAVLLLVAFVARTEGAVTIDAKVDPPEVRVGEDVTITFTAQGGSIGDIQLPLVDGLTVEGSSTSTQIVMNGLNVSQSVSQVFSLVATRAGDFTIPPFNVSAGNGQTLRIPALKIHVLADLTSNTPTSPVATPPSPPPPTPGQGPVVLPPAPATPPVVAPPATGTGDATISVPTGPDGRPPRVFHLISPQTTDAYVGQSIPLRIEFYIRADSNAQQNSLPTLIGSDFLMNNLSLRPAQDGVGIGGEEYIRDTWITAISAPKAGDFALEATRDTYWTKSDTNINDPFGGLFGRSAHLQHGEVGSNQLTIHVHPLPDEGRPAGFTGAIGKFQVTGNATPNSVAVGEPVTLHFTISGQGNFDYVRAPALASDPNWKSYVATSKINYEDDSRTQATKTFEQAIIPRVNGTVALPAATFSYFDPGAKRYVTVPVPLPAILVTGSAPPASSASASPAEISSTPAAAASPAAPARFAPNRLEPGPTIADLAPAYGHPWFWFVQAALVGAVVLGLFATLFHRGPDLARGARVRRLAELRAQEAAMEAARRENDAARFFGAARYAVQLRLADRWSLATPTVTRAEIERHDPAVAEAVTPLFDAADDVIYSGAARDGHDLAEWDRKARELLAQL